MGIHETNQINIPEQVQLIFPQDLFDLLLLNIS